MTVPRIMVVVDDPKGLSLMQRGVSFGGYAVVLGPAYLAERVVRGHEHGKGVLPGTAGPTDLLPQGRTPARPAGEQDGVQAGDVDTGHVDAGRELRPLPGDPSEGGS